MSCFEIVRLERATKAFTSGLTRVTMLLFLGLFEYSHMKYEVDRAEDPAGEPSIAEMTEKAIRILQKNPKGYFLLVEGRAFHKLLGNFLATFHILSNFLPFEELFPSRATCFILCNF